MVLSQGCKLSNQNAYLSTKSKPWDFRQKEELGANIRRALSWQPCARCANSSFSYESLATFGNVGDRLYEVLKCSLVQTEARSYREVVMSVGIRVSSVLRVASITAPG